LNVSRDMKRQQVAGYQLDLFKDQENPEWHGATGDGSAESGASVARQVSSAVDEQRALTQDLMERVAGLANLEEAVRRVCKNKGAAGADGMTTRDLKAWFPSHWRELQQQLLDGT
jgi:RNA-directed DNA polymerase